MVMLMLEKKQPYLKSPTEDIDFGINWAPLLKTGEAITDSQWTAPVSLIVSRQQVVGLVTSCYIAGGESDTKVKVFNKITTSLGRIYERFFEIEIEDIQV